MDRETVTRINSDLVIKEPYGGIRFGTDALLLAGFAQSRIKKGFCVDLGTGSGVLPLLLLSAGSRARFSGLEIQPEYAAAAAENAKTNGFERQFSVICGSADDAASYYPAGCADHVITNPPYMRADCGRDNENPRLSVARREILGGVGSFCRAAARCLKSGGSFFCVYRPDRITNLLYEMRSNGIEPKRLRAVFPSAGKKPSLILAEGKKDAAEGLVFENALYVYKNESHREYGGEMEEIYGRFSGGK